MSRLWKDFRTNMMYWRFRHITRNRLRLKSWWSRRRQTTRPTPTFGRPSPAFGRQSPRFARPMERGLASHVYQGSRRQSLTALAALVVLLTALSALAQHVFISPGIVYGIGALILVGCVYYALRGA